MPFNPVNPNAAIYGVIPQAYAQSLAQSTGDPTADAINRLNLGMHARGASGLGGYEGLIRRANDQALEAAKMEGQVDLDKAMLAQIAPLADRGISRAVDTGTGSYIRRDNTALAEADAFLNQERQAGIYKTTMDGAKAGAEAGITPQAGYIQGMQTTPWHETPVDQVNLGYIPELDKQKLAIDKQEADAAMISARKPNASDKSDEPKYKVNQIWDPKQSKWVTIGREVTGRGDGGGGGTPAPVSRVASKFIPDPKNPGKLIRNPAYKGP
jgi:hypothetical protein